MASRMFKRDTQTLESALVRLYGKLTFGSSGAVTDDCTGFSVAIVDSEAGRYKVTLEDVYYDFKGVNVTMEVADDAAVGGTAGIFGTVIRNLDLPSKTFEIQFIDAAGADADPTSGFIAHVEIVLKNSGLDY